MIEGVRACKQLHNSKKLCVYKTLKIKWPCLPANQSQATYLSVQMVIESLLML